MGKKPIVSVTYENERISIKNSLPYLKCVLRLSCVVHGPIYGRFMGSKYEHRRASTLLRNIQNIRICMGKNLSVSVTYENERISIKNSLTYLKCVLRLSCEVHGPIYGRFMGFYVNVERKPFT